MPDASSPEAESPPAEVQRSTNQLVFRNTLLLVGAKVLALPISVISTAIVARYLGPTTYSNIYLATTFVGFATLFVAFGQTGALPALVAVERPRAGEFLGTALVWRIASGVVVYAGLALGCWVLGYGAVFQQALALVFAATLITFLAGAGLETIRGFERTDVDALVNVGTPLLTAAITIPAVLLGGRLLSVLGITVLVAVVAVAGVFKMLGPVGVGPLRFTTPTLKTLLHKGYPFLFFSAAIALQPVVDAAFLSRLAPNEVVGWHAAAEKLIGLVVFPASALITALYPVLCRLYAEDPKAFSETTRSTLQTCLLLTVPVALSLGLFAEVGVMVFGEAGYAPVVDNLRVFAVYMFLVYISMPLGSAVLAAGKTRAWSLVQASCVIISVILDPLLIPWFQSRLGNGGLGLCSSRVASEVFMVSAGIWLLPPGVLRVGMLKQVAAAIAAGLAMSLVAWALRAFGPFVAAPPALAAYAVVLWLTGGLDQGQRQFLKSIASRRRR